MLIKAVLIKFEACVSLEHLVYNHSNNKYSHYYLKHSANIQTSHWSIRSQMVRNTIPIVIILIKGLYKRITIGRTDAKTGMMNISKAKAIKNKHYYK